MRDRKEDIREQKRAEEVSLCIARHHLTDLYVRIITRPTAHVNKTSKHYVNMSYSGCVIRFCRRL